MARPCRTTGRSTCENFCAVALLSTASPAEARAKPSSEHAPEYSVILDPVRRTLPALLLLILVAATLPVVGTSSVSAQAQTPAPPPAPAAAAAAPASQAPSPLSVVVLDPAHGGSDSGARGPSGVLESEVVLDFARVTRVALEAQGFHVVLTREGNQGPSFDDRSTLINSASPMPSSFRCTSLPLAPSAPRGPILTCSPIRPPAILPTPPSRPKRNSSRLFPGRAIPA